MLKGYMLIFRNAEGVQGQRKVGNPCYNARRTMSCRYGKRAFLICHNVWPSCYVTISQICHNACWCWRNTSDLIHQIRARCVNAVYSCMGRKIEVQWTANKNLYFARQFFRPRQSGAHGTCHAWHALDTPLSLIFLDLENLFLND